MIEELEREEKQLGVEASRIAAWQKARKIALARTSSRSKSFDMTIKKEIAKLNESAERFRGIRAKITAIRIQMKHLISPEPIPQADIDHIERMQADFREIYDSYASYAEHKTLRRFFSDRLYAIAHEIVLLELVIVYGELESLRWYMEEHNVDVGPVNLDSQPVNTPEGVDAFFASL